MKKTLALLLSLMMVFSLAACNGDGTEPGDGTAAGDGSTVTEYESANLEIEEELPAFNILVCYPQFTDKLGSQFKSSLEYLADTFNVTFTFLETGMGEETQATFEAALVNKPDGVITVTGTAALLSAAKNAGDIPMVGSGASYSSEELAQEVATYDNWLGTVVMDDYAAGWDAGEALYRDGCRNVAFVGLQKGLSGQHDDRAFGFLDFVASKDDMNLVAEDYSMGLFADAIISFAAAYPEMDGIFCTATSDAIFNTFETEGLVGSVKLAGIDVSDGVGKAFQDNILSYMCGGNYITEELAFAVLYNYLIDGTRVIEDTSKPAQWNNININSFEDYENYIKYLDSGVPGYNAEEIMNMIHYFNAEADATYFAEQGAKFSLEDVMKRHGA